MGGTSAGAGAGVAMAASFELIHNMSFTPPPAIAESAKITCHQLLFEQRLLFAGLADGSIALWRRKSAATQQDGPQVDSKPQIMAGHSGTVKCLLLAKAEGLGQEGYLLFSGSADRTVRVWDPSVKDKSKACVQTLRGHGGTVTAIAYCDGVLVSCSTDTSIRVWKADEGRELMLYPWFSPLAGTHTLDDIDCWVNDVALTMGEAGALYVGDEQGCLSAYKVVRDPKAALRIERWRRQPKAHSLGIDRLQLVPEEQMIITSGYDNTARIFDSQSGAPVLTIENLHKCRFTALHWDLAHQELVLGDEFGYVYFWNVATEKCVKAQRLKADGARSTGPLANVNTIKALAVAAGEVLVSTMGSCDFW